MKSGTKVLLVISGVLMTSLLVSVYFTRGPTILIETEKPAEDFVVLCSWASSSFSFIHGGRSVVAEKAYVLSSGKEFSCGFSISAGFSLAVPSVSIMHPVYWDADVTEREGIKVYQFIKTKLDVLDEVKARFGSGDQSPLAGLEYARSSSMLCGFPHQYLEYYSKVKKVDGNHFKKLYNEPILECKKRTFPLMEKYSPNSYPGKRPTPEQSMESLWGSNWWRN